MNKKFIHIATFMLILSGCSINLNNDKPEVNNAESIEKVQITEDLCEIKKVEKVIDGNSMSPLLKNGENINLLENYYKCGNEVQKGDLVAYHYGGNERPLIKMVRVISEDEVEIIGKKINVNGEILKNSVEQEYVFSNGEIKMLSLYVKDKHIPKKTFFLFGDNVSVSTDSRKFGAVSSNDFLGKFE